MDQNIDKINLTSTELATQSIVDFKVSDKLYMKKSREVVKVIILVELTMTMIELGIVSTVIDSVKSAI